MVSENQVLEALRSVVDPELHRNIVDLGMVRAIEVEGSRVKVTIALTVANCPLQNEIAKDAAQAVDALPEDLEVEIALTAMTEGEREELRHKLQSERKPEGNNFPAANLNRVKAVIAVVSGKGGVGKSTVAALLASELRRRDMRIGVLDADITGPSIPNLFGVSEAPTTSPLGIMPPTTSTGIKIMSINLMLEREEDAVLWRGPLIAGAIQQFWNDVFWGDLDALIVDMPPGTSDAALTVMQNLPVTGIVLVTSPQNLAEMVVRKAAHMASHLQTPIIGVVENMSYATCPECGERYAIFGTGNTKEMAKTFETRFLGQLGIDPEMVNLANQGRIEDYTTEEFTPVADVVEEAVEQAPEKHPQHHH